MSCLNHLFLEDLNCSLFFSSEVFRVHIPFNDCEIRKIVINATNIETENIESYKQSLKLIIKCSIFSELYPHVFFFNTSPDNFFDNQAIYFLILKKRTWFLNNQSG